MQLNDENWLIEDRLCCWNGDTVRAELSPRRVTPDGDGYKVVTPEQALMLEAKFTADWRKAIKKAKAKTREEQLAVKPNKKQYVMVDVQARHAPKVWKIYQLQETDEHVFEKQEDGTLQQVMDENDEPVLNTRFIRIGEAESLDDARAFLEAA